MRKYGFTIAELVISVTLIFIIMSASVPILLNKAKVSTPKAKKSNILICSCRDGEHNDTPDANGNIYCEFNFDTTGRFEFHSAQLVGGGSYSSDVRGGSAGEAIKVYFPTLSGKYRIVLGRGGNLDNVNGGNTAIYKVNEITDDDGTKRDAYQLVAYAKGGMYPGKVPPSEYENINADGEMPQYSEAEIDFDPLRVVDYTSVCGKGGARGSNPGNTGEVIIRW